MRRALRKIIEPRLRLAALDQERPALHGLAGVFAGQRLGRAADFEVVARDHQRAAEQFRATRFVLHAPLGEQQAHGLEIGREITAVDPGQRAVAFHGLAEALAAR